MPSPRLEVLGVYRTQISPETWQQQFDVTGDEEETREHFEKLVLIEAIVHELDQPFEMIKLGQFQADSPDDQSLMQVGYDEALLSADGEVLIKRSMDCVEGTGDLRFAVYLHLYDPDRPLRWQAGEVMCPPVTEAPVRLQMLVPYTATD